MRSSTRLFVLMICVAAPATSCKQSAVSDRSNRAQPAAEPSVALASYAALLDSANAAFALQQYDRARDYYTRATQIDSTSATAWFGLYMLEDRVGNAAMAEYALERARAGQLRR